MYIPIYVPLFLSVSSWGLLAISFFNLLRMRTADVHKREEGWVDGWRVDGWRRDGGGGREGGRERGREGGREAGRQAERERGKRNNESTEIHY